MMYKQVIDELLSNKKRRLAGDVIAIPWNLPRLSNVLPGIEKARYNIITSGPKAGKSQLTDFLYVYQPIEWYIANKDKTDISLKILYNTLEMSKSAKLRAAISYKLFKDYGIVRSPQDLQSVFGGGILDDETERIIQSNEFVDWFQLFESIVEFNDSVRHPYGIYVNTKNYMESVGHYTQKEIMWEHENGKKEKRIVNDQYIPNDPNHYVIVITDHVSLLLTKPGQSLHETIGTFSSQYCLHMRE